MFLSRVAVSTCVFASHEVYLQVPCGVAVLGTSFSHSFP